MAEEALPTVRESLIVVFITGGPAAFVTWVIWHGFFPGAMCGKSNSCTMVLATQSRDFQRSVGAWAIAEVVFLALLLSCIIQLAAALRIAVKRRLHR
jgi:hypothetical protein